MALHYIFVVALTANLPLPEIIGTLTPQAARAGAKGILILSPTPPVECLSTTDPCSN